MATTQVTGLPPTPLPLSSTSRTSRVSAKRNPAGALWPSPDTYTSEVGFAGSAVWVNVTGEPARPVAAAWEVWVPEDEPSTRSAAASPSAPLVTLAGLIEPPPDAVH